MRLFSVSGRLNKSQIEQRPLKTPESVLDIFSTVKVKSILKNFIALITRDASLNTLQRLGVCVRWYELYDFLAKQMCTLAKQMYPLLLQYINSFMILI